MERSEEHELLEHILPQFNQRAFAGVLAITESDAKKPCISVLICCLGYTGTEDRAAV